MGTEYTRRGFLTGSALGAMGLLGGAALAGCAPSSDIPDEQVKRDGAASGSEDPSWLVAPEGIPDSDIVETVETDVLVIGAGLAGVAAALSAAENGLDVIVSEKMEKISERGAGAGTINCSDSVSFPDGTCKSVEDAQFRWMQTCGNRPNEALVAQYLNRSGEAGDWLAEKARAHGCHIGIWDGYSRNPLLPDEPGYLVINGGDDLDMPDMPFVGPEVLYLDSVEAGATYLFESPAEQLVKDDSGAVVGAVLNTDEGYKKVLASKGTVLATGDIGGSEEMCDYYCPIANTIPNIYTPMGANTGDGHKMALWAGAQMQETPFPTALHPQRWADPSSNQLEGPFLYVNEQGDRFFNEGTWVQARSLQIMQNTANDCAYSIFDASWPDDLMDSFSSGGGMFWDMFREKGTSTYQTTVDYYADSIEQYLDDVYFKADTLEELAQKIGVPADTFADTVARYNELCATGYDEDFHKNRQFLYPIETPPFYASKVGAVLLVVVGGIQISTNLRCLDSEGEEIEGLYAVGNVSGDLHAVDYPINVPGNSHGRALTQGYLIGRMLAGVE